MTPDVQTKHVANYLNDSPAAGQSRISYPNATVVGHDAWFTIADDANVLITHTLIAVQIGPTRLLPA